MAKLNVRMIPRVCKKDGDYRAPIKAGQILKNVKFIEILNLAKNWWTTRQASKHMWPISQKMDEELE